MRIQIVFAVLAAGAFVASCAGTPRAPDAWVTLECTAEPNGAVSNCSVVDESNPGEGFAAAAIEVMGKGRMSVDATATEPSQFRTTIRFNEDRTPGHAR